MSNITNFGENQLLVWQLTAGAVSRPTAWYVGAGTGHTDTGLTGEPSGNGYARQVVSFTVTNDAATNSALLVFGPASASWGSMASVAVFDAVTGGNCLWAGALTTARTVDTGDSLTIAASALSLTIA
jgi:hypothetical protein